VKRLLLVLSVLTLLSTLPLSAEAVDGYLMDTMCSVMMTDKGVEGTKKHTKACAWRLIARTVGSVWLRSTASS